MIERKWGYYKVLAQTSDYVVKELNFKPSGIMSNQRHFGRAEHWFLIKGELVFNGKIIEAPYSLDVPVGTWHEARNISSDEAIVIETWTGETLDENDIERKES
jgi:mannose-6-phosphate isomerase-like protein (cupin superfamily)